jgi:hypothetical protein
MIGPIKLTVQWEALASLMSAPSRPRQRLGGEHIKLVRDSPVSSLTETDYSRKSSPYVRVLMDRARSAEQEREREEAVVNMHII